MKLPTGEQLKILTILAMVPDELAAIDILNRDPSIREGTIYAALMRLEDKGFLTSRKEAHATEPGRPRRYYKLTAIGARMQKAAENAYREVGLPWGSTVVEQGVS